MTGLEEIEAGWKKVQSYFEGIHGESPDMQGIIFLIGVQELGKGYRKFTKDQKLEVMHIAVCTLLSPYGYYEFIGVDEDGWPHWKATEKLPHLKPGQQAFLMKQAIVDYFTREGIIS